MHYLRPLIRERLFLFIDIMQFMNTLAAGSTNTKYRENAMPIQAIEEKAPKVAKVCKHCGHKLDALNKKSECRNTHACEARQKIKFEAERPPYAPPVIRDTNEVRHRAAKSTVYSDTLTFEHILNALCERFGYTEEQKKLLQSDGQTSKYQRARYILLYLLIEDLDCTHKEAAGYLNRNRRTGSIAYYQVKDNLTQFDLVLKSIREKYPADVKLDT